MAAGSHYADEQRREAVAQYVVLGNWRKVAEATGIPQRTLGDWAKQPWFHTLIAEVRAEKGAELDGQLTRIIHKATDQLMDRLDQGCLRNVLAFGLADGVGFEPTNRLRDRRISSPVHSTALPPIPSRCVTPSLRGADNRVTGHPVRTLGSMLPNPLISSQAGRILAYETLRIGCVDR